MSIKNINTEPVILCGMHRSGTAMLTGLLHKLGVYIGNDLEVNNESLKFMLLNDELLTYAHSFWDEISGCFSFFENDLAINEAVEIALKRITEKSFSKCYLGSKKVKDIKVWGWKDPRNTLTFPIWNKVFPNAKVVIVYRNGVDSADSLVVRENNQNFDITIPAYSSRNRSIEGAFELWEQYNMFFLKYKGIIKQENLIEIKYEDFLLNSKENIIKLISFLGLSVPEKQINEVCGIMNAERAYSFIETDYLRDFYNKVKNSKVMKELGYSNIEL